MQKYLKGSDLLKKLILSRYNTLGELANKLQIDISTLSRKIKKPSRAFLIQLKSHKVPVPDDMINPNVEKIKVFVDEDGNKSFRINEPHSSTLPDCATFRTLYSIVFYGF
jgi:hypothetical protein